MLSRVWAEPKKKFSSGLNQLIGTGYAYEEDANSQGAAVMQVGIFLLGLKITLLWTLSQWAKWDRDSWARGVYAAQRQQ